MLNDSSTRIPHASSQDKARQDKTIVEQSRADKRRDRECCDNSCEDEAEQEQRALRSGEGGEGLRKQERASK